jgi:hypothetical protein
VFGFGSRNPQLRYLRLGALVVLILAGSAFHHSGPTYDAIRVVYYALILGVIGYALYHRSGARRRGAGLPGPGPSPTFPGPTGTLPPTVLSPGWYPDHQDMKIQRYWDGTGWTATRTWDGAQWVDSWGDPTAGDGAAGDGAAGDGAAGDGAGGA